MIDEPTPQLDEGALRALVPRVLAGLVRRGEDFDAAEDAQRALVQPSRRLVDHAASVVRERSHMISRTSIHSYSGSPPGPGSDEA